MLSIPSLFATNFIFIASLILVKIPSIENSKNVFKQAIRDLPEYKFIQVKSMF